MARSFLLGSLLLLACCSCGVVAKEVVYRVKQMPPRLSSDPITLQADVWDPDQNSFTSLFSLRAPGIARGSSDPLFNVAVDRKGGKWAVLLANSSQTVFGPVPNLFVEYYGGLSQSLFMCFSLYFLTSVFWRACNSTGKWRNTSLTLPCDIPGLFVGMAYNHNADDLRFIYACLRRGGYEADIKLGSKAFGSDRLQFVRDLFVWTRWSGSLPYTCPGSDERFIYCSLGDPRSINLRRFDMTAVLDPAAVTLNLKTPYSWTVSSISYTGSYLYHFALLLLCWMAV